MMRKYFMLLFVSSCLQLAFAQGYSPNYDETKVPDYTLPDALMMSDGSKVNTVRAWEAKRKDELLQLFSEQMFGKVPSCSYSLRHQVLSEEKDVFGGLAVRKQVKIILDFGQKQKELLLLIYIPQKGKKKYPLFFAYNFSGNQTIYNDPGIIPSDCWCVNSDLTGVKNNKCRDALRGCKQSRWPVEMILSEGYAVATMCYNEIFPDHKNGFSESILSLMGITDLNNRPDNSPGAISAWAWGMSRVMDYLEQDKAIDKKKVIIMGHSRIGKAALWAGVQDPRFSIVISNNSGCSGAALSRRKFGETVEIISTAFPHWFCKNYFQYRGKEETLPFDQHELLALVAPRPLYVASAGEDLWADPKGEYLAAYHAGKIYNLYGYETLAKPEMPSLNFPQYKRVGYHIRTGKHDVTAFDWLAYIAFANKWLK